MRLVSLLITSALLASVSTSVLAAEWTADRLRGSVSILEGGRWVPLSRGDIVADRGKVRTEADGRAELVRGKERVSLAANTLIELRDGGSQLMTSVIQSSGSVTVDAERRNVQHFSVQTPVLAAVVKGTKFTVTYNGGEASVSVDRGEVQVQDSVHEVVADIVPGQTASASKAEAMEVTGRGSERIVYLIEGEFVPAAARQTVLEGGEVPPELKITVERDAGGVLRATQGQQAADKPGNGNGRGSNNGNATSSAGVSAVVQGSSDRGNRNGNGGNGNNGNGNGNSGSGNNGNGNGNSGVSVNLGGVSVSVGSGNGNNGNGNSAASSSDSSSSGSSSGGTGNSGNGNSGNGNSGNGNGGNSSSSNGNGNSGNGNNGNGNSGNGNSGNGNGNNGNGNGNGGSSGNNNSGNGNSNGTGNGNSASNSGSGVSLSVGGVSVSAGSSGVSVSVGGIGAALGL